MLENFLSVRVFAQIVVLFAMSFFKFYEWFVDMIVAVFDKLLYRIKRVNMIDTGSRKRLTFHIYNKYEIVTSRLCNENK